ncbi:agamous-like MADS-box protein AGL82 [Cornus florida]|uniref:agamous-like MADS-box protein AGL82 n=1 Tax=Cornus florida TaxID=4283 RepID=UPI0028993044|nr:agamous-like MADS-box protein AGL82 [Cornus florida]
MGRAKLEMKLISNERARNITFQKRKKCLKKKIYELTTLCDVKACMIIYGPRLDDRPIEPEIWPTDLSEIQRSIKLYKDQTSEHHRKRTLDLSNFFEDRKKKAEYALEKQCKKNEEAKYPSWDDQYDQLSIEQLKKFHIILAGKLEFVKKRIESIKGDKIMAAGSASASGMMDSFYAQSTQNPPSCFNSRQPPSMNPHDHINVPIPYNPFDHGLQFNPNSMMMRVNDADGGASSSNTLYAPLYRPVYYDPLFDQKFDQNMIVNNARPLMCYYGPSMQPMPQYVQYPPVPVMPRASSHHMHAAQRDEYYENANKPVDIEVPQAVLPDTVFEAVARIPYDMQLKQVLANGKRGALNVGAVLILPEGFESIWIRRYR